MKRKPRHLSKEERDLWSRVASSAKPMHPAAAAPPLLPDAQRAPMKGRQALPTFELGEAVRPLPMPHDIAPGVADSLAAQPLRMDKRRHQDLRRGKIRPEARIDLHGMTLAEAQPDLTRFILSAHAGGKRMVLVITGKGKRSEDDGPIPRRIGVLRHQVPNWLTRPPLSGVVQQVVPAHPRHGGDGALYVYLRRSR